ncbi:MAG: RNA 2',3'-cyclic phosphodiesterase [Gammaproteobacteria bacterium]|nr:RNA 2',3'-cyclic phosphodiesterase [Gammaproteobacteria bacterium]
MKAERIKAFFAVAIPDAIQEQLVVVMEQLQPRSLGVDWIPPEKMHITMRFLGNIAPDYSEMAEQAAAAIAKIPPFSVQLHSLVLFPSPQNPRILVVKPESYIELLRANLVIEKAVQTFEVKRRQRAYVPHVTLGRLAEDYYLPSLDISLPEMELSVEEITFFQSVDGVYMPLVRCPLMRV